MGHQIIKQPNGKYSIWSTVVDHFVVIDSTPEEIIEYYCEREKGDIIKDVTSKTEQLDKGENPYGQFRMDWEEALCVAEECHGRDDKTLKLAKELGNK
jgi:hypothetical protein